jgi:hypothetical protein
VATTRGNLAPAVIYQCDKEGSRKGDLSVDCMFNPFEYTVSQSNRFSEPATATGSQVKAEHSQTCGRELRLSLVFDTYESGDDVQDKTKPLWELMLPRTVKVQEGGRDGDKYQPPLVAFEWGSFKFVASITNITQKFTLFKSDGKPVRARVDVSFKEYVDPEQEGPTNPTSGGGPVERIWHVVAGDRLDTIAAEVYGSATQWRRIAERNRILNPLTMQPGQRLRIPID